MEFDGFELGPVLIRDLARPLSITYERYGGEPTPRRIYVRSVHGRSIDAPAYLRAVASASGDEVTFRIDRILALQSDDGARTVNIAWAIGQLIRDRLGLPRMPEPFSIAACHPVRVGMRWGGRPTRVSHFILRAAAFGYRDAGWVLVIWIEDRGGSRQVESGPGAVGWRLEHLTDLETGSPVLEPLVWLESLPVDALTRLRAKLILQIATFLC